MTKHNNRLAWVESLSNVGSGLLLSILIVQPLVFWYYDISLPSSTNVEIAVIFTVVSIIRGYVWRRYFHKFYNKG